MNFFNTFWGWLWGIISALPGINVNPPSQTLPANGSAMASIAFAAPVAVAPGGTLSGTLTLKNDSVTSTPQSGATITLPAGFTVTAVEANACGKGSVTGKANILTLSGVQITAGQTCNIPFKVITPVLALAETYLPAVKLATSGGFKTGTTGSFQLTANTPVKPTSNLGTTPGAYMVSKLPFKLASSLTFTITPKTDPGPDSNVFWSNQINPLRGYTGIQSTYFPGKQGRQFLFSLWGAVAATAGNSPLTHGGFCHVSTTVADGSPGAGCYTYYDWKPGHVYQFTVKALGNYQFKSTVTDVTPGLTNPDSFDIGTITVDSKMLPDARDGIPQTSGGEDINQWVEYFEWNSARTTCMSVPYSSAEFTTKATDLATGVTRVVTPYHAWRNDSCTNVTSTVNGSTGLITAGIGATARGFVNTVQNQCIAAEEAEKDNVSAILAACPSRADILAGGAARVKQTSMVYAPDKTLQYKYNYCLTAKDPAAGEGSELTVVSCVPGALNQKWNVTGTGPSATITSGISGRCISPFTTTTTARNNPKLVLSSCSSATSAWKIPGMSSVY